MMSLAGFEVLLKQSIGLDADSIGLPAIERAVQTRQLAFDGCDRTAYWQRLRGGGAELQALIEAVVVPETWFFRDPEAFTTMAQMAREQCLSSRAPNVIRILSVPSSTGEEPYSMAMALLDAGVPADRFHIDAADVSARALASAEVASYGRNSFRGKDLTFRDRYFDATPHGHRLKEPVRTQVQFQQGNILAPEFLSGVPPYDAIFCRNLLIYFDRETQSRAISVLRRLLRANGTLFVAPSETGMLLNRDFESARVPLAFAFHKRDAGVLRARTASRPRGATGAAAIASAPVMTTAQASPPKPRVDASPVDAAAHLNDAMRLADLGRIAEAGARCDDAIRQFGPSAALFHLKGLLCDSAGDLSGAAGYYRKALYLDPAHHDALIHLALVVEQQGDLSGAKVLKDRARRHDRARQRASGAGR